MFCTKIADISQVLSSITAASLARIPMGMSVSAGVLVKVVNKILEPLSEVNVLAYLDDILIMSPDEATHISDVNKVLLAFEQANLLLNPRKCDFAATQAEFLGFKLTSQGIQPSDKHVAALKSYKPPRNVKDVVYFLAWSISLRSIFPTAQHCANL